MAEREELRETVRAAFACYDEDDSGWIDAVELRHVVADLGGVLTERDLRKALRLLDKDGDGVVDREEFTDWWMTQTSGEDKLDRVETTLRRLKDLGRQRFRVDVHTACWNGDLEVVARLVEADAGLVHERDTSEYGNGNSPLHYAAYQGHLAVCQALIQHGANINATNGSGCTPVFFAAQQAKTDVVEFLLQHGVDLRIAEKEHSLTPVDVSTTETITKLFRDLSGRPPAAPAAPILETLSDTELKALWSPPQMQLDEVVPVSGYKLKVSSAAEPTKVVLAVAFPTEMTIPGLSADTEYVLTIAAINLHGIGKFSVQSEPAKTRKAKPSPPLLRIGRVGSTSVSMSWELAEKDRGPGLHCVLYQSSPEPDGTCAWKAVFKTDGATTTSTIVEDLLPDKRYKFRVAAINEDGQQALSTAIAARTANKGARLHSAASKVSAAASAAKAFASPREAKGCKGNNA